MKIYWQLTGDSIDFYPIHEEFSRYYVESFQKPFSFLYSNFNLNFFTKLQESIRNTNEFLSKFKIEQFQDFDNLHDQEVLNRLHEKWVKLHLQYPNLGLLAWQTSRKCKESLDNINHCIHNIEHSFNFDYCTYDLVVDQVDNIFGDEILNYGRFNIVVNYDNLGRSTFDKWMYNDNNITDIDTNDYREIGGMLTFNIKKSYTIPLPNEYIEFCKSKNIKALPDMLPLGNFKTEDLTSIRKLFITNSQIENNPILLSE